VPLAALTPFITAIWVGFAMTAVSGTALLVADASTKMQMPVFYVKLVFVALALVSLHLLTKRSSAIRWPTVTAAPPGAPAGGFVAAVLGGCDDGRAG
jgi:hypothetical protein